MNNICLKQNRWLWKFAVIVALVTTLPYFLGYYTAGDGWTYSGFVIGVEDGNSYIAKMFSGTVGNWLFRTPYTSVDQKGFLAFLPYLLLGKLAGGESIHTQLVVLFHVFRIVGCFLFVFATYDFCKVFLDDIRWQRWATVLATFGGGLGWLTIFGVKTGGYEQLPLEFYSPESFGFLGVFSLPHLAVARALLLWGLAAFLSPLSEKPFLHGARAGLLWLLMGFMQPLTIVSGWAVVIASMACYLLKILWGLKGKVGFNAEMAAWRNRLSFAAGMVAISSPMVVYNMLAFSFDPYLRDWAQQNLILSPPPGDYLLAYGVVLPFAVIGAVHTLKSARWQTLLLIAWILVFPILAYFPYPLQRRLPEGVWVAWVVLGLIGVGHLRRRWQTIASLVIASGFLATLIIYVGALWTVATVKSEPMFLPNQKVNAFTFLADNAPPFSTVLSSYRTGNSLPAWAPLRVVIGHGSESANLAVLEPQVTMFFSTPGNDNSKIEFIQAQHVDYIFWGPDEKVLGGWNPADSAFLHEIYSQNDYQIYQVVVP